MPSGRARGRLGPVAAIALAALLAAAAPGTTSAGALAGEASGPDIVAQSLTLQPENPEVGEDTRFLVNLTNGGEEATGAFNVTYEVYDYAEDRLELVDTVRVEDLAAGETLVVSNDGWNGTEGKYAVRTIADADEEVNETEESNNTRIESFVVGDPDPNLVAGLHLSGDHVLSGETLRVGWSVHNEGLGDAGSFATEVRVDGETVRRDRIEGLSAGSGLGAGITVGPIEEAGFHEIAFVVDVEDEVNETDERDNVRRATVEVIVPPDPALTVLDIDKQRLHTDVAEGPANPIAGQEVTLEVANLAQGDLRYPVTLEVTACPEEAAIASPAIPGRCEHLGGELLEPDEIEAGASMELDWDTAGKLGDWEICAHIEVHELQLDPSNDELCEETFVAVGGTGLGGVDGMD